MYRDKTDSQGAIAKILLRDGGDDGKILIKAFGNTLGLPFMPLSTFGGVTAQLLNLEADTCWSSTYSSALRNDAAQFRATSD